MNNEIPLETAFNNLKENFETLNKRYVHLEAKYDRYVNAYNKYKAYDYEVNKIKFIYCIVRYQVLKTINTIIDKVSRLKTLKIYLTCKIFGHKIAIVNNIKFCERNNCNHSTYIGHLKRSA